MRMFMFCINSNLGGIPMQSCHLLLLAVIFFAALPHFFLIVILKFGFICVKFGLTCQASLLYGCPSGLAVNGDSVKDLAFPKHNLFKNI